MKITSDNYFATVAKIGVENLSPALKKGHELIDKATKGGTDWKAYDTFKKQFDLTFEVLAKFIEASEKPKQELRVKTDKPIVEKEKPVRDRTEKSRTIDNHKKNSQGIKQAMPNFNGKDVELINPETVFIRRFASLHNKTKTKEQVLSFIRSLQKAIVERRVRKTSKHSTLIEFIQKQLVDTYKKMGKDITFKFTDPDLIKYKKIGSGEMVMYSVRFIKAYINLQGKEIAREKAKKLYNHIVKAIETKKLTTADKYYDHIQGILHSLEAFTKLKMLKHPYLTHAELNGLQGILKSCGCNGSLNGVLEGQKEIAIPITEKKPPHNTILNSQDVVDLKTDKLNFTGKWLDFIGNPSRGFTAMIYGRPKFGKSYLAIDFAGYLARNHGKVLYVAYEEGFDDTLKQKLQEKNVAHPNLDVADYLPANLKGYDYVFIDSVNKAGLTPDDLDKLERKNPSSFIYVYQTTKDGSHKGAMEHKHNVDIIIEVPQRGIATQYGRYNQGGEMKIFNEN